VPSPEYRPWGPRPKGFVSCASVLCTAQCASERQAEPADHQAHAAQRRQPCSPCVQCQRRAKQDRGTRRARTAVGAVFLDRSDVAAVCQQPTPRMRRAQPPLSSPPPPQATRYTGVTAAFSVCTFLKRAESQRQRVGLSRTRRLTGSVTVGTAHCAGAHTPPVAGTTVAPKAARRCAAGDSAMPSRTSVGST
jgi:hypothetical protein